MQKIRTALQSAGLVHVCAPAVVYELTTVVGLCCHVLPSYTHPSPDAGAEVLMGYVANRLIVGFG